MILINFAGMQYDCIMSQGLSLWGESNAFSKSMKLTIKGACIAHACSIILRSMKICSVVFLPFCYLFLGLIYLMRPPRMLFCCSAFNPLELSWSISLTSYLSLFWNDFQPAHAKAKSLGYFWSAYHSSIRFSIEIKN